MSVIFVACPPDQCLHLAPEVPGMGVSCYTLCLRKWKRRERTREGPQFCRECLAKLSECKGAFMESRITIPAEGK